MTPQLAASLTIHEPDVARISAVGEGVLRAPRFLPAPASRRDRPELDDACLPALWRREALWLRFATAFNWCQWLLPLLGIALMLLFGMASAVGLPQHSAGILLVLCLGAYGLWLHWFLARHGLQLSGLRAALLVATVNLGTALLVLAPRLLAMERG